MSMNRIGRVFCAALIAVMAFAVPKVAQATAADTPFYAPISPACVYNTAFSLTSGQNVSLTCDSTGALRVNIASGSLTVSMPFPGNADAQAASSSGQGIALFGYNGTTFDRLHSYGVAALSGTAAPGGGLLGTVAIGHCVYSTASYTYTSGNIYPVQCDNNGNIKVTSPGAPLPENTPTVAGTNQGIGIQFVSGTNVVPVSSSNPLPVNCISGGCLLPFFGNTDGQAATSGTQAVALMGFNNTTYDRIRSAGVAPQAGTAAPSLGALQTVSIAHCVYSTTAITATSGNMYPLQCDANGNLKTLTSAGAPSTPLPTTTGAPPTAAPPSVSEQTCYYTSTMPTTATNNMIARRCDQTGGGYTVFNPGGIPYDAHETQISAGATCQSVSASPLVWGVGIVNEAATAQTVTLTLYNTGSASCTTTTQRYSVVLGASQYIIIPQSLFGWNAGLYYTLSGPPSGGNIGLIYL